MKPRLACHLLDMAQFPYFNMDCKDKICAFLSLLFDRKFSEQENSSTRRKCESLLWIRWQCKADNRQIMRVPIILELAVADNIWSSLSLCSMSCTILNWQFFGLKLKEAKWSQKSVSVFSEPDNNQQNGFTILENFHAEMADGIPFFKYSLLCVSAQCRRQPIHVVCSEMSFFEYTIYIYKILSEVSLFSLEVLIKYSSFKVPSWKKKTHYNYQRR